MLGYLFLYLLLLVINVHSSRGALALAGGKQIVQYEIQRAATKIPSTRL